jgi:hypothetical protein
LSVSAILSTIRQLGRMTIRTAPSSLLYIPAGGGSLC